MPSSGLGPSTFTFLLSLTSVTDVFVHRFPPSSRFLGRKDLKYCGTGQKVTQLSCSVARSLHG
ncbi:hypothetical protein SERLADRAFT_390831 [Serpula lacrymans var. lacrymans S7.9]|uniref:Uncharacterized protein n=1 Tax=Serpula lacrymans var. lacrymans (strain S7.9) TaxID=578457 RepID=F8NVQ1_SERL9|nr:uncharacterized protein SERLADRAFT_390831 [Serpula lacrymans var. lacrymans S7.9]EGO24888.1 hypothetical protein SERLADRAFT_390831 [Serpula lacrymans var. lacrymans S7.9]